MKKLLIVVVSLLASSACVATNQQTGSVIGGIAGGILGNQIGGGSGKEVATGIGVLLGAMTGSAVGESMDRSQTTVPHVGAPHSRPAPYSRPAPRVNNRCSYIRNSGVRSSCERGIADRRRQIQREAERNAYQCSRYGRCNIFDTLQNLY